MTVTERGERLPPGVYDEILSSRLEEALAASLDDDSWRLTRALKSGEVGDRLALHLALLIERAIDALPEDRRVSEGSALIRSISNSLDQLAPRLQAGQDAPIGDAQVLRAVYPSAPDGSPLRLAEPEIPLVDTTLLTNAPSEPSLSHVIRTEIVSADRIDAIIAFIRFSGIRPLLADLRRFIERGKHLRILTTTFTSSTEQSALDALADIGAEIRVSYQTGANRLHAKSWLFVRQSGASTGYVGSSNLSHAGQVVGQEWNVRLSGRRNPAAVQKLAAAFEGAWDNGDFRPYDPQEFATAIAQGRSANEPTFVLPSVDLRLEPFQERLLEQVEAARRRGRHRNLLVAATGTGKTVMAAVDYTRLRRIYERPRLLFVAHREEILSQSQATFRLATRDPTFGERWVGGDRPADFQHVFASIQSLAAGGVEGLDPSHFDVVIIDEFHHAAARSYQRLLDHLEPRELLGLTATPERADGLPILHWFDNRISAELRLWDAIDQQRLVPFSYYGIYDGADLRSVPWQRGLGYDTDALANLYTASDIWARQVLHQVRQYVGQPLQMRALCFCVNVAHAEFMARQFQAAGISAAAVTSKTPDHLRRESLAGLRDGSINVICSVDLFNEGVDVPEIDTLIMLRPTESATVFLQQLGRGLRQADGKAVCTVLDFIGHHRAEFRFDIKYRALLNVSRRDLEHGIRMGFPRLPSGATFQLDRVAGDLVIDNVRRALPNRWPQHIAELRNLLAAGYAAELNVYLRESGLDLEDVYQNGHCWSDLLEAAGQRPLPAGPHEAVMRRGIGRLLHIDDDLRIDAYEEFVKTKTPPATAPREQRLLRMLVVALASQALHDEDLGRAARLVWQHPQVLSELTQVLPILRDRESRLYDDVAAHPLVPLQLHARYTREEILAAMGEGHHARTPTWREGVRWAAQEGTDLFLVTLNKTDGGFSPTTQYRDYAISPTLFHWESQSTTSATSPTGQRYQHHEASGSDVFLFARMTNASDDRAFWFLGPASYVEHTGSRPMAITWRLHHALPGDLYATFAAVAVA